MADHHDPMDRLDLIQKQLSQLTDEELEEIIRGERKLRAEPPKQKRTKAAGETKKAPKKTAAQEVGNLLDNLDPATAAALLQKLTQGGR